MANESDDLEIETKSNYWLHTARSVKVLGLNGVVVLPILVLLFYPRWWVLFVAIAVIAGLALLERFGYPPVVALRALRSRAGGARVKRNRRLGGHRIWRK